MPVATPIMPLDYRKVEEYERISRHIWYFFQIILTIHVYIFFYSLDRIILGVPNSTCVFVGYIVSVVAFRESHEQKTYFKAQLTDDDDTKERAVTVFEANVRFLRGTLICYAVFTLFHLHVLTTIWLQFYIPQDERCVIKIYTAMMIFCVYLAFVLENRLENNYN